MALLVILSAIVIQVIYACSYTSNESVTLDLGCIRDELSFPGNPLYGTPSYKYSPCGNYTECDGKMTMVGRYWTEPVEQCNAITSWDPTINATYYADDGYWSITFIGGHYQPLWTTIIYACVPEVDGIITRVSWAPPTGSYLIQVDTKYACLDPPPCNKTNV